MSSPSTLRAPPPWRWSLFLLVIGFALWASLEFRAALYALRTATDTTDTVGRVAFSTSAGLGFFVGSIITVWLFTGGVRQARQAWFALAVSIVSLFAACFTLSQALALPEQIREAESFRASPLYQAELARYNANQALLMPNAPYLAPQNRTAIEEAVKAAEPTIERGREPAFGHAKLQHWLLAIGQHLLAAGFGSAFRVPIPAKRPKPEEEKKPAQEAPRQRRNLRVAASTT